MHVFVTGASGWIGSAVVPELIGAGHRVTGLARSEPSAEALTRAGAQVRRGTLDDLDVLRDAAAASDGVVHLAFKHDIAFTGDFQGAAAADRAAVEVFGDVLAGTGRPLVIASGLPGITPGRVTTERDGVEPDPAARLDDGPRARMATADLTRTLASRGVRSSVLRLPPTVHGEGDPGFISAIIGIARATGVSAYIGDGSHRWPAGHRDDAAHLFRLALEDAEAGATLHAVADEGVAVRDIAEVIGRHLGVPVTALTPEEASAHFGWIGAFLGTDMPASSTLTRAWTGWSPTGPGLIEDLGKGHYFHT
ncbi:SDR family oxidoreductase [Phytomonospora endophytica]|uniref:Nucleoside-diphosphate-sugar epimerase n=1 Tax=Phytomonospora endophytica TaxID=714109 RepID=A0A841FZ42_9ACTN|nr:SDR family oxidoreductase [Phytomonospora endophytica]MBB6038792.1 nucleoside-diphosphate-sugar epimerase [Phytomonospora endophytica]GIG68412.1 oxidoreductase [Phytomonospora endophytica]